MLFTLKNEKCHLKNDKKWSYIADLKVLKIQINAKFQKYFSSSSVSINLDLIALKNNA